MDHALSFAIIAGLLGLTLLGALLLRQGFRVHTSLETLRAGLPARPSGIARVPTLHAPVTARSAFHHEVPPAGVGNEEIDAAEPHPARVTIPALDLAGNPSPRRVMLSTLLRAVGIGPNDQDPGIAVIAQVQCEIRALAQFSTNLGARGAEDMDFSDLGAALEGISHRLEVASEILDSIQTTRSEKESSSGPEEPPATEEPPSEDDSPGGQNA